MPILYAPKYYNPNWSKYSSKRQRYEKNQSQKQKKIITNNEKSKEINKKN
jgi:hypothetical protein